MLRHTFIHGPGIGTLTERSIWQAGARTWEQYLEQYSRGRFGGRRHERLASVILHSCHALDAQDVPFFGERLASCDQWRLHDTFADRAAYVDVETTGFGGTADVTVIALSDGRETQTFVRGQNLDQFPRAAAPYPLIVTFNGAQFDLPFLGRTFGGWKPAAHIDLRFALQQIGYTGGLKAILHQLGMIPPAHVRGLTGIDAIRLWQRHERGSRAALTLLLDYVRHDAECLSPLAVYAVRTLSAQLGFREMSDAA
jgi:uncharacterized protein